MILEMMHCNVNNVSEVVSNIDEAGDRLISIFPSMIRERGIPREPKSEDEYAMRFYTTHVSIIFEQLGAG